MALKSLFKSVVRYFHKGRLRSESRRQGATQRRSRLCVEYLEGRDLMATAPFVASVTPTDGQSLNTGAPTITVTYSEAMRASAANAANYVLLDSTGTPVTINAVTADASNTSFTLTYNGGLITGATNAGPIVITSNGHGLSDGDTITISGVQGNTAANNTAANPAWTVTRIDANHFSLNGSTGNGNYTGGGSWTRGLTVNSYTLFVRGDKVFDVDDNLPLASPSNLIVANSGSNNVAVVTVPGDGTLGAVSDYSQPTVGTQVANPYAVAFADLDGGVDANNNLIGPDLIVVNAGTNTVSLYQSRLSAEGYGYSLNPDSTLALPTGTPNQVKAVIAQDFNKDGLIDLVVMNSDGNSITTFLNTRANPGTLSFDNGTTTTGLFAPIALRAADFDNDGWVDLAVANSALSGTNYTVQFLRNNQSGGWNTPVSLTVGTNTPTGITAPTGLALGDWDLDGRTDIAVAGTNGIGIVLNTSTLNNISFSSTVTLVSTLTGIVGLNSSRVDAGTTMDILYNTATDVGVLLNDGGATPKFTASAVTVTGGAGGVITTGDIDNDGRNEIAVTNAGAPGQVAILNGTSGYGVVADASNTSDIAILSRGHGLATGDTVTISGATSNTAINNTFTVTVQSGAIASATASAGVITILSINHGLNTGDSVTITGNTLAAANGTFTITRINANAYTLNNTNTTGSGTGGTWVNDRFTLNGSTGNGAYAGSAVWARTGDITNATITSSGSVIFTTASAHKLTSGTSVTMNGVGGIANVNGITAVINVLSSTTFEFVVNNASGTYTTGGTYTVARPLAADTKGPYAADATPTGVAFGDTNRDGFLDLVTADRTGNDITVMLNAGDRSFLRAGTISLTPRTTRSVAYADLNGDGRRDIIIANNASTTANSQISIMLAKADGTYTAPVNYNVAPNGQTLTSLTSLATGDFNGDGKLDIVYTGTGANNGGRVGFLYNNLAVGATTLSGTSFNSSAPVTTGNGPTQVVVADFNNDNKLDLAVSHNAGGNQSSNRGVSILLGNGNGTWQTSFELKTNQNMSGLGIGMSGLVALDYDKDGKVDLAAMEDSGTGKVYLFKNTITTNQSFTLVNSYDPGLSLQSAPFVGSISAGDFNGDGFTDVVVASPSTGQVSGGVAVLLNQLGTGLASGLRSDVKPGTGLRSLAVTDINLDGILDLVVGAVPATPGAPADNVYVLTGLNTGLFNEAVPYLAGNTLQTGTVTSVTQSNRQDVRVTSTAHGLSTGDLVTIAGDSYARANGTFTVTRIDANTFSLNGTSGNNNNGTGTGGTWVKVGASTVAVGPAPLVRITTFRSGGTVVQTNVVTNGDFESTDLTGEKGNLTGWQTYKLPDVPTGSVGAWSSQTGTTSPLSGTTVGGPSGSYQIMLDQANLIPITPQGDNNNPVSSYSGSHALYQDLFIPGNATLATLSMRLLIKSSTAYSDTLGGTQLLDYRTAGDNMQVRVDILDPATAGNGLLTVAPDTATTPGVLQTLFITTPADAQSLTKVLSNISLLAFKGQTVRLRIAVTNNRGPMQVGVDDVKVMVQLTDSTAPTMTGLTLQNPGFLRNGLPTTTDTTLIGRVGDNAGVANIDFIEFDTNNDGFTGAADDYKIAAPKGIDVAGYFSFTVPNLVFGIHTIGVRVVDKAGNVFKSTFTFDYQAISTTDWQAAGPNSLDVSGVDYSEITGRITAIDVDSSDPLGKTYYVGTANGGIWKTTDGGTSWTPLMDFVTDSAGNRVYAPIGSLAVSKLDPNIIYAGTGVADLSLDSRAGTGVLKSIDGGKTWTRAGNSSTVMNGARISKILIDDNDFDPSNPTAYGRVIYAAVADMPTATSASGFGGAVFKSTDGGQTWVNVLDPTKMTRIKSSTALAAGTEIASVTDMVLDPFNAGRLIIGLGNAGFTTTNGGINTLAGVWLSTNGGNSWQQKVGGDQLGNVIPYYDTALAGWVDVINPIALPTIQPVVGTVKLSIGNGRIGDEKYVYAFLGTPPGNNTPPNVSQGGFLGLYKSDDNMLTFNKIMLKQDVGTDPPFGGVSWTDAAGRVQTRHDHDFRDITFGVETAYSSFVLVDPTNPNVIYVGGSRRYTNPLTVAGQLTHALIRVDTGNMRASDGDDAYKAAAAATQTAPGFYYYNDASAAGVDPYVGEGVYWYDIEEGASNDFGNSTLLPYTLHSLRFDAQGRLLIGTDGGIWRGISYGFNYDYTSGGTGILRNVSVPPIPGMTVTSINANLQIPSLTSVAIDPVALNLYYVTMINNGEAASTALLNWASQGLTGPTVNGINLGIPSAGLIRTTTPAPGAPDDTPSTVFRLWQFANQLALVPEISGDNGASWTGLDSTGINLTGNSAGYFPALAINPTKIFVPAQGLYADQLIFGTNAVYLTETTSNAWDRISPQPLSSLGGAAGNISALAIAPTSSQFYYAGTYGGEIFVAENGGGLASTDWPKRVTGLPTGLPVTSITALPNDPTTTADDLGSANYNAAYALARARTAYVTFGGNSTTASRVWKTTNGGLTWTSISDNLPKSAAYALVIDPQANFGTSTGKVYVATDQGVFVTLNDGGTWVRIGSSLPTAPVVDLQLDPDTRILAAATQGRGLFLASGAPIATIADQSTNEDTPITITVSLNDLGIPASANLTITASATSNNQTIVPNASLVFSGSGNLRTLTITPAKDQFTTTTPVTITVTASDGTRTFSESFDLTINPINDAPTVTAPANQSAPANTAIGPVQFTVGDVDTGGSSLTVTATSDNQAVIKDANIVLGIVSGTNGNTRTIKLTPEADTTGSAIITITVTDPSGVSVQKTFAVQWTGNANLPFTDNFNRADNPFLGGEWVEETGDFSVASNQAKANNALNIASLTGVNIVNAYAQMVINLSANSGTSAGLIVRHTGTGDRNYYLGGIYNSGSTYTAFIGRNMNGSYGNVAVASVASGTGTLRFEAEGSSLKLFLNDTLILFGNDIGILTGGTVGIRTDGMVAVDNFAAGVQPATNVTLPKTDNFNTDPAGRKQLSDIWTDAAGNVKVDAGVASNNSGAYISVATLNGVNATNVAVQADISLASGSNRQADLVARYQGISGGGEANFYTGLIWATGSGYKAEIYKNVNGAYFLLNSQTIAGGGTLTGTLKFEAIGASLKLFLNDTLVAFASDTTFASGSVGIRSYLTGTTFDNFSVSATTTSQVTLATSPATTDDFSTSDGRQQLQNFWTEQAGNFQVASNIATSKAPLSVATLNLTTAAADVAVQADISVALNSGKQAGVIARYQGVSGGGDANYYTGLVWATGGGLVAQIYKNVGGNYLLLSSQTVSTGTGTLRLEAVGASLKLFLNDNLVGFANDTAFASGSVGIRTYLTGTTVDTFSANLLTVSNASLADGVEQFNAPADGRKQLPYTWTEQAGNFIINGNATSNAPLSLAIQNGIDQSNVAAEAAVNLASGSGRQAGVVVRYKGVNGAGDANYYTGLIWATGSGYMAQIYKNVGGSYILLSSQTVASGTGTLRLEAVDTSLKLYLNGTLVGFANDTTFASGSVGIRTYVAGTTVDDYDAAALSPASTTLVASPAFTDDFSTTDGRKQLPSTWTEQAGNFELNGGASGVATGKAAVSIATLNGPSADDVTVQADVSVAASSGRQAGVVARYTGQSTRGGGDANYYLGLVWTTGSGFVAQMYKNVNGNYTLLSSQSIASGTGTLRMEVVGTSQKLFFNDVLVGTATDTTFSTGDVGVRTYITGTTVDNFAAATAGTAATIPFSDGFTTVSGDNQQLQNYWVERTGNFKVNNGVATNNASLSIATLNGISQANATLTADIALALNSGQQVGLVGRYAGINGGGDANYYTALVWATGSGYMAQIYKNVNGSYTQLGSTVNLGTGATLTGTLGFVLSGTTLKLQFNGTDRITVTNETTFASGGVGMRAYLAGTPTSGTFDNFTAN